MPGKAVRALLAEEAARARRAGRARRTRGRERRGRVSTAAAGVEVCIRKDFVVRVFSRELEDRPPQSAGLMTSGDENGWGGAPRSRGSRAGGIRAEDRDSIPSRGILDRAAWGPVCRARYGRESTQRVRWSPRPSGQPVRRADGQWGPVLEALAVWHPQGNTRAGCAARIEVAWRTNSTPHHLIPGSLPLALTRRPPGGESKCSRGCPNPARRSLKRENPYWPAQSTRGFFAAHAGAGLGRTATTAKKTMRALRRTEAGHLSSLQARLRHGGID